MGDRYNDLLLHIWTIGAKMNDTSWTPGDRVRWRWYVDETLAENNGKVISDSGTNVMVKWDDGAEEVCSKGDLLWMSHATN